MASKPEAERVVVFQSEFLEDLSYWVETERRAARRLLELVKAAQRDPFKGIGNPEPLKYLGSDVRSRRITQARTPLMLPTTCTMMKPSRSIGSGPGRSKP